MFEGGTWGLLGRKDGPSERGLGLPCEFGRESGLREGAVGGAGRGVGVEDVRTCWRLEGKETTGLERGLRQPLFGSDGALWCPALTAELLQLPHGIPKRPVSGVGGGSGKA